MKTKRCRHKWTNLASLAFGAEGRYISIARCDKCSRIRFTDEFPDGTIKRSYPGPEFKCMIGEQ